MHVYLYAEFVLLVLFHCIVDCGCIVIINELVSVHDGKSLIFMMPSVTLKVRQRLQKEDSCQNMYSM